MKINDSIATIDLLIEKCRKNDRKAQFEVYRLYSKTIYNTTLRILNNTAEAEDAMQEAFLKAYNSLDDYRFESSFATWLRRIAINISLDYLRKRKVTFQEISENQYAIIDEEQENFDSITEATIERIKKMTQQLPDGYRTIISLYLFEGFDYQEIAQITGVSETGVRSQYCRAKKKLLEFIKQHNQIL